MAQAFHHSSMPPSVASMQTFAAYWPRLREGAVFQCCVGNRTRPKLPWVKLRIRGDSLRLRLGQSEVERVASGGTVEEVTHFAQGQCFRYVLRADSRAERIAATLSGSVIEVTVPAALAQAWATTEQVSLEAVQKSGDHTLTLLVEKDFQCLIPRSDGEDHEGFPNPNA